mmetsp:Transcript_48527/g.117375  ORF Transcript_48527/g.117375 Transcript_48527/m.117375 type:complete len:545 (-) Transcript_48527:556-2190(-)
MNRTNLTTVQATRTLFVVLDVSHNAISLRRQGGQWSFASYENLRKIEGSNRFYAGTPIFWRGFCVASLCVLSPEALYNVGPREEIQLEQIADLMMQQIEVFKMEQDTERLETERKRLRNSQLIPRTGVNSPEGTVTFVFIDIQGWTRLWEANPVAMQKALRIHDSIMRIHLTEQNGFEITTEGDAFQVAFHDSVDAIRFALGVQEDLQDARWDDDFLLLQDGVDDGKGTRGARVRMAIHAGPVDHRKNVVSGRREYVGDTVCITKALEDMAHSEQVLVTTDVWNSVAYVAETILGSPQVICLGEHVVKRRKKQYDGVTTMGIIQAIPSRLSYDCFFHGVVEASDPKRVNFGRLFPPPITKKQVSPSFFDAPFGDNNDNTLVMFFIYTNEVEKHYDNGDNAAAILAVLAKRVRNLVICSSTGGYQCKNWMLAFRTLSDAATFGNELQTSFSETPVDGADLGGLIKVGIHEGKYTSCGPHRTTGKVDYFGQVVNRAARVAGAARPGDVCVGRLDLDAPPGGRYLGSKILAGMYDAMNLFSCRTGGA